MTTMNYIFRLLSYGYQKVVRAYFEADVAKRGAILRELRNVYCEVDEVTYSGECVGLTINGDTYSRLGVWFSNKNVESETPAAYRLSLTDSEPVYVERNKYRCSDNNAYNYGHIAGAIFEAEPSLQEHCCTVLEAYFHDIFCEMEDDHVKYVTFNGVTYKNHNLS